MLKKSLIILVFIGIIFNFYSTVVYGHFHTVDGRIIYHSHPFNSADNDRNNEHRHNRIEFLVLDQISKFKLVNSLKSFDIIIIRPLQTTISEVNTNQIHYRLKFYNSFSLRAPPYHYFIG